MPTVKEEVMKTIEVMGDDCTLEGIQYSLYVKQKVEHGLNALENGDYLDHEEVEKRMEQMLGNK